MNSKSSFKELNEKHFGKALALAFVVLFGVLLAITLLTQLFEFNISHHEIVHNQFYAKVAISLSTANIFLLVYLLAKYIEVYFIAKSNFTLGLILVVVVLLAHSATSNPIFYSYFGFWPMNGPFAFIPSIFTLLASIILIYLERQ